MGTRHRFRLPPTLRYPGLFGGVAQGKYRGGVWQARITLEGSKWGCSRRLSCGRKDPGAATSCRNKRTSQDLGIALYSCESGRLHGPDREQMQGYLESRYNEIESLVRRRHQVGNGNYLRSAGTGKKRICWNLPATWGDEQLNAKLGSGLMRSCEMRV